MGHYDSPLDAALSLTVDLSHFTLLATAHHHTQGIALNTWELTPKGWRKVGKQKVIKAKPQMADLRELLIQTATNMPLTTDFDLSLIRSTIL